MEDKIVIGKIVAPHGVRGEFRILPQTERPQQFLELEYLLLPDGRRLRLTAARMHKNVVLAKAEGIDDMDSAERLRDLPVAIEAADLPTLPEGHFYVRDLLGFNVVDMAGSPVGTLRDVIPAGSTDVYVIERQDGSETMIPAVEVYVKELNIAQRLIRVVEPEWMD